MPSCPVTLTGVDLPWAEQWSRNHVVPQASNFCSLWEVTSQVSVWGQGQEDMCVNTETFLGRGPGSEPWALEHW